MPHTLVRHTQLHPLLPERNSPPERALSRPQPIPPYLTSSRLHPTAVLRLLMNQVQKKKSGRSINVHHVSWVDGLEDSRRRMGGGSFRVWKELLYQLRDWC